MLMIRNHYHVEDWELDDQVTRYVVTVRLQGVSRLGNVKIDHLW